MPKTNALLIMLDETSPAPLYRQIYDALCRSILNGNFPRGMRLPSTRQLAEQLGVARMTIVNAYEQLLAEGYLEGKTGAGTYVAAILPEAMLRVGPDSLRPGKALLRRRRPVLSARGRWLAGTSLTSLRLLADGKGQAFQNGLPALDDFPFKIWSQLAARRLRNPPREMLTYGDPAGYLPLRVALAEHLRLSRGVNCDQSQVIIVAGAQQAVDLTARILLEKDDPVWMEDPGYPGARNALLAAGANVISVPIDEEGFALAKAVRTRPQARLVYVTPSHQFPLGVTMSLSRRLALLEWAKRSNAFIVEDDYDSEYRYAGRPLAALQGLDQDGRVIYVGTLSKTIFPSLRLGCMVVPKDLTEIFITARGLVDRHSSFLEQVILADFIAEGHFARHLRRMRSLYAERQEVLVKAVRQELQGRLEISPAEAGMHLVGWLPPKISDQEASARAARHGVQAAPLSAYSTKPSSGGGLVLGYAGFNAAEIKNGARRLSQALA